MTLPKFNLHLRSNVTVLYDGVPMLRKHAWALADARHNGVHFVVNSADRRVSTINKFKGKGLKPGYHSQAYLWAHQHESGFFPANTPGTTSHCLYSDGQPEYRVPAGHKIPPYMLGIDLVDHPGGNAYGVVNWLNNHGYRASSTYFPEVSERHHLNFVRDPSANARKRLASAYAKAAAAKAKKAARPKHMSAKGIDMLTGFEGVRLNPYNDPAGFATIGVGHLLHRSKVTAADKARYKNFTKSDATELLKSDLADFERAVDSMVKPRLTQNQFDALVSFAFNVGTGSLQGSTLLKKLNAGDKRGAADEFLKWNKAGSPSRPLPGLTARRAAERNLFLK